MWSKLYDHLHANSGSWLLLRARATVYRYVARIIRSGFWEQVQSILTTTPQPQPRNFETNDHDLHKIIRPVGRNFQRGVRSIRQGVWGHSVTLDRFRKLHLAPPSPTFLKSILSLKSRFWPQIPHLILKSPSPHKFEDSSRYNFEEILKYLRVNKNIP